MKEGNVYQRPVRPKKSIDTDILDANQPETVRLQISGSMDSFEQSPYEQQQKQPRPQQ